MSVPDKRYLDRFDSAGRKSVPMFSGVMAYFPDAIAALAEHSYKGNQKHNPGEPLHHARGKSMDHTDCIMRHVANYEGKDGDALEVVALFWRAAALCQETLERKYGLTLPSGATDPRVFSETNSLVGPNGEQAPLEAKLSDPLAAFGNPVCPECKQKIKADEDIVLCDDQKYRHTACPSPVHKIAK